MSISEMMDALPDWVVPFVAAFLLVVFVLEQVVKAKPVLAPLIPFLGKVWARSIARQASGDEATQRQMKILVSRAKHVDIIEEYLYELSAWAARERIRAAESGFQMARQPIYAEFRERWLRDHPEYREDSAI